MTISIKTLLLLTSVGMFATGCRSTRDQQAAAEAVHYVGTSAFASESQSLLVSRRHAADLAAKFCEESGHAIFPGELNDEEAGNGSGSTDTRTVDAYLSRQFLLIDGEYLFASEILKDGLSLNGVYVSGTNGAAEWRMNQGNISISEARRRNWPID